MVEAIIFSCSSGSRYRNFVLATKINVTEIGFACGARLFTWRHHGELVSDRRLFEKLKMR
jgi:hypothetical protein